jgi:hypothetical protein
VIVKVGLGKPQALLKMMEPVTLKANPRELLRSLVLV